MNYAINGFCFTLGWTLMSLITGNLVNHGQSIFALSFLTLYLFICEMFSKLKPNEEV